MNGASATIASKLTSRSKAEVHNFEDYKSLMKKVKGFEEVFTKFLHKLKDALHNVTRDMDSLLGDFKTLDFDQTLN